MHPGQYPQTEYPKETLAFLKLMYKDSTVMNLLTYGIEGIHYQVLDEKNGVISFPEGVDIFNSGYAQFRGYFYNIIFPCEAAWMLWGWRCHIYR